METLQISKSNAIKAFNEANSKGKELLKNLFGEKNLVIDITERIKSFEDACECLNLNPKTCLPSVDHCMEEDKPGIIALAKLSIIRKALNEGWTPNWKDDNEAKYFPYFERNKSGVGFSYDVYHYWDADTTVGSRLCFKSSKLAEYAGKQFIDLYNQFLTIPQ